MFRFVFLYVNPGWDSLGGIFLNRSSIKNLYFSLLQQFSNATNSNRVTKRCPVARKETKERRREILIQG